MVKSKCFNMLIHWAINPFTFQIVQISARKKKWCWSWRMVLLFSKPEVLLILVGTIVSIVSELIVYYAPTFFIFFSRATIHFCNFVRLDYFLKSSWGQSWAKFASEKMFFSCHNSLLQFCETRLHFKVLLRTELNNFYISNGRGLLIMKSLKD